MLSFGYKSISRLEAGSASSHARSSIEKLLLLSHFFTTGLRVACNQ
jgi:hypothetical protein